MTNANADRPEKITAVLPQKATSLWSQYDALEGAATLLRVLDEQADSP